MPLFDVDVVSKSVVSLSVGIGGSGLDEMIVVLTGVTESVLGDTGVVVDSVDVKFCGTCVINFFFRGSYYD